MFGLLTYLTDYYCDCTMHVLFNRRLCIIETLIFNKTANRIFTYYVTRVEIEMTLNVDAIV